MILFQTLVSFWFLFIAVHAIYDALRIRKGRHIDHTINTLVRIFVGSIFLVIFAAPASITIGQTALFAWFLGGSFWFGFDLLLNIFRGKHWAYIGRTAMIDKLFLYLPGGTLIQLFLKLICILTPLSLLLS